MKDETDKFTPDLIEPVPRRGRKPSPTAKTPAQRAREYRQRRKAELEMLREIAKGR